MNRLLWVLFTWIYPSIFAQQTSPCFQKWENKAIACGNYFERRSAINEENCKNLCLNFQPRCVGVVYNIRAQRCDLYDIQLNPGGNTNQGGGYRRRWKRWGRGQVQQPCNNQIQRPGGQTWGGSNTGVQRPYGQQGNNAWNQNAYYDSQRRNPCNNQGQNTGQWNQNANGYGQNTGQRNQNANRYGQNTGQRNQNANPYGQNSGQWNQNANRYGQNWNQNSGQLIPASTACQSRSPSIINCANFNFYKPTGSCRGTGPTVGPTPGPTEGPTPDFTDSTDPTDTTPTDGTLPDDVTCPRGEVARFMEVDGYELVATGAPGDVFEFAASTPDECTAACAENRLPDGKQAPCRSVQFDINERSCKLSSEISDVGSLVENPDSIYHEKICIDEEYANNCPGPFRRVPQSILVGFAQTVVDAADLNDCLAQCLDAEAALGFQCNSGMIFYEQDELNCVLNIEMEETQPEMFTPAEDEVVDYFEPGCFGGRQLKLRDIPLGENRKRNTILTETRVWGPWTACDPKTHKKARFRYCEKGTLFRCQKKKYSCASRRNGVLRTFRNRRIKKCNIWKECCPLLTRSGEKDCQKGRRLVRGSGLKRCKPDHC